MTRVDPGRGPAAGRLEVGDRLISLERRASSQSGGTQVHRRDMAVETPTRWRSSGGGEQLERTLGVAAGPETSSANRLTLLLHQPRVWCAVGLFIGFARPEHPWVARLRAFGAAVATGLVYLGGFSQTVPP